MGTIVVVPYLHNAIGKFVAGFVQHNFDQRIENLKSELRRSEEKFAAELRNNDLRLRSLSESALSLRSTRQAALDTRRLEALERLWAGKCSLEKLRVAALFVSLLNTGAMQDETDDPKLREFLSALDKASGIDLTKEGALKTVMLERPFLPQHVWVLYEAFQGVLIYAALFLKVGSLGGLKTLKKEDTTKPTMLSALPEYADYIEKYGVSGYYNLLPIIEQKLLQAISEMLDGKEADHISITRSAEIWSAVQRLDQVDDLKVPEALRDAELPTP
jgi:hypothetical protein